MADKNVENEQVPGIVNLGGNNTYKNTVVGDGAMIVNGEIVRGEDADDKLNKDNKKK